MNRSLIFVPSTEDKLSKIEKLDADIVIIDLEDSISADDKDNALERICGFLEKYHQEKPIFVRLNSNRYIKEAERLKKFGKLGFMLPKFEKPESYEKCLEIWENHPVIALIETPSGIVNVEKIVSCNWIAAVAFGAEDYTASVGMKNHPDMLLYQKSMLVTYAKANSKKVYDTPSFSIGDDDTFRYDVDSSAALGFDGKMLIHPKQIEYINNAFSCSDPEYLRKIVEEYERSGKAVLVLDGRVYEEMHIKRIRKILAENS